MMMRPYFHFYAENFLEGVHGAKMTLEQVGFYAVLLCEQWRAQGPLLDDHTALGRLVRRHPSLCRRLVDELVALGPSKLSRADGHIWTPRLMKEIDKQRRWALRQAAKGRAPLDRQPQLPWLTHPGGAYTARRSPAPAAMPDDLAAALARLGDNVGRRRAS